MALISGKEDIQSDFLFIGVGRYSGETGKDDPLGDPHSKPSPLACSKVPTPVKKANALGAASFPLSRAKILFLLPIEVGYLVLQIKSRTI